MPNLLNRCSGNESPGSTNTPSGFLRYLLWMSPSESLSLPPPCLPHNLSNSCPFLKTKFDPAFLWNLLNSFMPFSKLSFHLQLIPHGLVCRLSPKMDTSFPGSLPFLAQGRISLTCPLRVRCGHVTHFGQWDVSGLNMCHFWVEALRDVFSLWHCSRQLEMAALLAYANEWL